MNSLTPRVTLINVAGVCHGPEKYARSPIHDLVTNLLKKTGIDLEVVFVPSAEIQKDEETNSHVGIQQTPHKQQEDINRVVQNAINDSRIPIAIAHSSGSIATIAALREDSLKNAVIVSPTFLDPINEIFESPAFKKRLIPIDQPASDYQVMMSPAGMDYSTLFPRDHFADDLYLHPLLFCPDSLKDINALINEMRLKVFIGQHDWNDYRDHYPKIFGIDLVEGETHSFEENPDSIHLITEAIQQIANMVSLRRNP